MEQDEIHQIKEVAHIIVQICFDTNHLEHLYENDIRTPAQRIFEGHGAIQKGMDRILASDSVKRMIKNVEGCKEGIKNTLDVYKNMPLSFDHKTEIMLLLEKLLAHLTDLQLQLERKTL
ncbi:MAG: hypothetical protein V7724_09580 [Sediminicola sp.]|tara:strand:- start:22236 stop:22592 length:357 start_codon:yes stop_codon:yes gene_type:complete